MNNVTTDYCLDIIHKFEVSEENKAKHVLGIEGKKTIFLISHFSIQFSKLNIAKFLGEKISAIYQITDDSDASSPLSPPTHIHIFFPA